MVGSMIVGEGVEWGACYSFCVRNKLINCTPGLTETPVKLGWLTISCKEIIDL